MSAAPPIAPDDTWQDVPPQIIEPRTAILVSADTRLRRLLTECLKGLRWRVCEVNTGAQAMMLLDDVDFEAMILDSWLPDLQVNELAEMVRLSHRRMDLLFLDGRVAEPGPGRSFVSSRRNELLHAMREAIRQVGDSAGPLQVIAPPKAGNLVPGTGESGGPRSHGAFRAFNDGSVTDGSRGLSPTTASDLLMTGGQPLPDLVGDSRAMREIASLVRMVAPRTTTVLIEGETGTGKEVIAKALHKLSPRARKPFAVLNCAAIPESLLEAELFGHTRGAFTGAVQSRMGRIEAAHGGTLLLDEIGEMPMAMQAKMLRFLESGELQRVGDNEITRVDVRLIAATHQPLEENAKLGIFRLDLYHRLAVFPIEVPPLRERLEDIPCLAEHFLDQLAQPTARKHLREDALMRLQQHQWAGNVRELMHVLERAVILSGQNLEISAADIRYRRRSRG
ncbi:MAG TPA: sigma 54-interacting transcriptional regulator [Acidobacteriaceae bacterium]|jgi:DNA-binding NtrC family response regulator|nr:sigma 54-interacting transcriptional regulator [Acidobacteriaceae bacterium]